MKQVSYGVKENSETLINTGSMLGNTWQHPKIPILKPLNIAEAPRTAVSALLKASLGEEYLPRGRIYPPRGEIPPQGRISIYFICSRTVEFHRAFTSAVEFHLSKEGGSIDY